MNRLDRLTSILIQLQTKRVVKAEEISKRFEISLRTVYRDVKSLMSESEKDHLENLDSHVQVFLRSRYEYRVCGHEISPRGMNYGQHPALHY